MHFEDDRERFKGVVVPPIFQNTLFTYKLIYTLANAIQNDDSHYVFGRGTNPTVEIVEKKIAALERGEVCRCFASGMAAISAAILIVRKAVIMFFVSVIYIIPQWNF